MPFFQNYALHGVSLIPTILIVALYVVPIMPKMHSYALHSGSHMANLYIFMLEPCAYIYTNCTLCGVPLMPNISFSDLRMPPLKRKPRDISHETKGVGMLYLEEHWSFVDEQLTSDFILTHGHFWFHLITHQFYDGNITSLILPLHTTDLLREDKHLVNCTV